uniref:RRM domain-containing protein n=1 Tax=Clastoptera arizonana TaxID=38151 RepID=A0A1B6CYQ3_9HEMI
MASWVRLEGEIETRSHTYKISVVKRKEERMRQPSGMDDEKQLVTCLDGIPVRCIFIQNIPRDAEWKSVKDIFVKYGTIRKIYLKTQGQRGFAFITFADTKSAYNALKRRIWMDRRELFVSVADSWHQPTELPDGSIALPTKVKHDNNKIDEKDDNDEDEREDNDKDGREDNDKNEREDNYKDEGDDNRAETDKLKNLNDSFESLNDRMCINILNDDCLCRIFSFLDVKWLLKTEQVCKRWQALNMIMWRSVRSVDFSTSSFLSIPLHKISLECVLRRCNSNLKVLDLTKQEKSLDYTSLGLIAKYCKNIEELYLSNIVMTDRSLPHLTNSCSSLKKILIEDCSRFSDSDLFKFFKVSTTLTSVEFIKANSLLGGCLTVLKSSPLEKLRLDDCFILDSDCVLKCLENNHSTLRHFSLNTSIRLPQHFINALVDTVPNLTSLSLSRFNPLCTTYTLVPLGKLSQLKYLNLCQNRAVTDSTIACIVKGCPELQTVNLSGAGLRTIPLDFTADGLSKLGNLKKLRNLDISYLFETDDITVINIASKNPHLKDLKCVGCPNLSDNGCISVISLSDDLENFEICGNHLITQETVKKALESVKMRSNRVPLKLIVGGTSITDFASDDIRLTVIKTDTCVSHLRPDFEMGHRMRYPFLEEEDDDNDYGDYFRNWYSDESEEIDSFYSDASPELEIFAHKC